MTFEDRFRGGLWGMFVGDALAMPVHWYYDVAALQRDFGTIRDYRSPNDVHPNSIMSLASTGRAGRGSQPGGEDGHAEGGGLGQHHGGGDQPAPQVG